MNWDPWVRVAGAGLVLIVVANAIAPRMLGYRENLARCDRFFGQVFTVHAVYIVLTVAGMAALCLWQPGFYREFGALGRAVAGFLAVFWLSRTAVQVAYYDRGIKRRHAGWNRLFTGAFACLGVLFGVLAFAE